MPLSKIASFEKTPSTGQSHFYIVMLFLVHKLMTLSKIPNFEKAPSTGQSHFTL